MPKRYLWIDGKEHFGMNVEEIIQTAREKDRADAQRGERPFLKEALRQIAQNGYFTAGPLDEQSAEPVVLLHPLPASHDEHMFHNHSCFELAFTYRGSCRNKLRDYEISLSQGDLLLLNPNAVHCMCTGSEDDVVFNFLCPVRLFDSTFMGLLPDNPISNFFMDYFYQTKAREDFLIVNVGANYNLFSLLEKLILEFHEKQPGYETILRTGLAQVFVYMARLYGEKLGDLPVQRSSRVVRSLILYITRNASTVTLTDAARALNYNEKYISRLMKQELGVSFMQFVQQLRLQNATELLTKTNLSIEEIVRRVGYTNQSHFYSLFQKRYGMTPAAYRAQFVQNI